MASEGRAQESQQMSKYRVRVWYEEEAYVTVEADSIEEAEDLAYEAVENGEADGQGSWDEPDYKFEVEEIVE